ncbi:dTDP-4-dehydrorhamnose 3,5-epimerase family protein [Corynebacterium terpenotabidum]|uniref:dTDP-4-dehydrorhamnose 3,5-epimerase n=1 Tax=Corynebacterium terpenotabidum Y-11 TaxID=1200352 RepID=S4XIS4_9CORY|nr:dTDP-4-dehydrorhamnose 3,5-epimerase [Corynebacterium terpenotabidum]AGP31650.1 dTDP-4-dehydrorhamnose 3,5-epimerase [Corynebacterium terpenotabidum Y-11]
MSGITDLPLPGTWVNTPRVFPDDRGEFLEWFRAEDVLDKLGHPLDIPQANLSTSAEGVVRGIHYADVPPGQAKYVTCVAGRILDIIVDLRRGSPTYGRHITVELSAENRRGLFLPVGVGHGFVVPAGAGPATVCYLVSEGYNPGAEHGVSPLDADLGIDFSAAGLSRDELILSAKDRDAPGYKGVESELPLYAECLGWEKELRHGWELASAEAEAWEGE